MKYTCRTKPAATKPLPPIPVVHLTGVQQPTPIASDSKAPYRSESSCSRNRDKACKQPLFCHGTHTTPYERKDSCSYCSSSMAQSREGKQRQPADSSGRWLKSWDFVRGCPKGSKSQVFCAELWITSPVPIFNLCFNSAVHPITL